MTTILCYGDSNSWGCKPMHALGVNERYPADVRWTGVLGQELGAGFEIITEGLNARTTVHDDPFEGAHKNGRTYLLPCLESHLPLDLVIIMLGTNDLKSRFALTAFDIASGVRPLLEIVGQIAPKNGGVKPAILVIAPPPLGRLGVLADIFAGGSEKSRALAGHLERICAAAGCAFMDAGTVIRSSDEDGVHFDADQHTLLGRAVAARVRTILDHTGRD